MLSKNEIWYKTFKSWLFAIVLKYTDEMDAWVNQWFN